MKFLKNTHYCVPFTGKCTVPKLMYGRQEYAVQYTVKFNGSIRYIFSGDDQHDVNKLFGVSYGWHHNNSDRIGFRYSYHTDSVEMVLYSYADGERLETRHICYVEIGEDVKINLNVRITPEGRRVHYSVIKPLRTFTDVVYVNTKPLSKLWYTLTGYFGGNRTAPHEIIIDVK